MKTQELEWKAEFLHNRWMTLQQKQGFHHPDMHRRDRFALPPARLRADGATYCAKCHLSMVPYDRLSETQKNSDRMMVTSFQEMEDAWVNSKQGKHPNDLPVGLLTALVSLK